MACFLLKGYSQGDSVTANAIKQISSADAAFDAIKSLWPTCNPQHRRGLACNIDTNGGDTSRDVNRLSASRGRILQELVPRTRDVYAFGDGVCDTTNGLGIKVAHLTFPNNAGTQRLRTEFGVGVLTGGN